VDILFQRLYEYDDWMELEEDPDFRKALWSRYNTVRKLWEDAQQRKQGLRSTTESIVAYLWDRGWPEEYKAEEFKDQSLFFYWVATNHLVYQRHLKGRQSGYRHEKSFLLLLSYYA